MSFLSSSFLSSSFFSSLENKLLKKPFFFSGSSVFVVVSSIFSKLASLSRASPIFSWSILFCLSFKSSLPFGPAMASTIDFSLPPNLLP